MLDTYAFSERRITRVTPDCSFDPPFSWVYLSVMTIRQMLAEFSSRVNAQRALNSTCRLDFYCVVLSTWYLEQNVLGFANPNLVIPRILIFSQWKNLNWWTAVPHQKAYRYLLLLAEKIRKLSKTFFQRELDGDMNYIFRMYVLQYCNTGWFSHVSSYLLFRPTTRFSWSISPGNLDGVWLFLYNTC